MEQVGGRTKSFKMNGATYDLGAEWIGDSQKYIQNLARRAGN